MKYSTRITAGVLVLGLFAAGIAFAGKTSSGNVTVDLTNRMASGGLGGARNSGDMVQFIGCFVQTTATGTPLIDGQCRAKNRFTDSRAASVTCTIDPAKATDFATIFGSMNSDSFIKFTWKVVNNQKLCDSIEIRNESPFEPKLP